MLQNASYMFFLKKQQKKQNKKTTKKKEKVSPGRSRTRDLRRVRATHSPLRLTTIVQTVGQLIVFNIFGLTR